MSFKNMVPIAGVIGVCGIIVALALFFSNEFKTSFAYREFQEYGVLETYRRHYFHFMSELDRLVTADQREESLVNELALTRRDLELERTRSAETELRIETRKIATQLNQATGSGLARTPLVIRYQVPDHLPFHQLFVMGMEYFRTKEFEKSAMIFQKLVEMQKGSEKKFPELQLLAAISWYQNRHYRLSLQYLKEIRKHENALGPTYRQSLIWQAIVEKKSGKLADSQKTLEKLAALHSQSEEVFWLNRSRKPSSAKRGYRSGGSSHE
jgi:hypothetical protein